MKRLIFVLLACTALTAPAYGAQAPLTNAAVIQLHRQGIPDASIVTIVQQRPGKYDLSPGGTAALRKAGIGDDVIAAIQAVMAPPVAPAASSAAEQYDGQAHAYLISAGRQTAMAAGSATGSVQSGYHPGLFAFGVPSNLKFTSKFDLKGSHAPISTSATPVFELDAAHTALVDPAHVQPVILRLHDDGPNRTIGTQTTNSNPRSGVSTVDPIADDRVPVNVTALGAGRFRLTPQQPLSPGEYGIAMRDPDVKPMTYSSSTAAQMQGESKQQAYQGIVWDFSVQP